jgi:SpoVK/Ycf46/Vps4 family AAA+-type ATPase
VSAGLSGDIRAIKSTVESIIAEEKQKQHTVLADRLTRALHSNGSGTRLSTAAHDPTNRAREFLSEITPKRQLNDLILSDTCRSAVDQLIEEQQRASLLRAHGLDPRHRILLVGPPGNGKTSLAEAIAEALAVPFFVVRYETMIGSYLGETASRLKRIFDYMKTTPSVLFFDEFDAIGKERGDTHETGEIKRVVSSLLMQVDELPSYTVVVAASNHAELLDRAAWRRFQLRIVLPAPSQRDLSKYFSITIDSLAGDPGVTPANLARRLGSISYAEAEEFILDVKRRAILSMNEQPLKSVIAEQLRVWEARAAPLPRKMENEETALDG